MGSARPFPLDSTAAKPPADRAALRSAQTLASAPQAAPTWPVLARIAEIAESGEPPSARPSYYRVDSPHADLSPTHTSPNPEARPVQRSSASPPNTDHADPQDHVLASAPFPIRVTAQAWRLMQPYLGIIRFAAMVTLMAIGGTSMTLMMGGTLRHADRPPSPSTTVVDQTSALQTEPSPIEPQHPIESPKSPDAGSSSIAPTAVGPAASETKPLMAIETKKSSAETTTATKTPLTSTASAEPPTIPSYPTTPYPAGFSASMLPPVAHEPLPQVQTGEPAIARLRGVVIKTETR